MSQRQTSQLYDKKEAVSFYEDRYAQGYMEDWPEEKKQRIFDIVRGLPLPETGSALDFGCGNGVLTEVVRQALPPKWTMHGTDLSEIATGNAARKYPQCVFFVAEEDRFCGNKFDLIFTHHVLEHVYSLPEVVGQMNGLLNPSAAMLHVLPCGNAGSFEHDLCRLRADGIATDLEGRFFFEEEGHVRRLTTEQLSALLDGVGFRLSREYYSNQYHGAIDWITQSGTGFVRMLTDSSAAVDGRAKAKLRRLRGKLMGLSAARRLSAAVDGRLRKSKRSRRDHAVLLLGLPGYVVAKPLDLLLKKRARQEWQARNRDPNGSEMYLFFERP